MIKTIVRYPIYTLIGYILRCFINYDISKGDKIKDIIVLGRGDSLNLYPKNNSPKLKKIKNIVCVNFEPKDFRVVKNYFRDKVIHLFLNVSEPIPSLSQIMKIKFGKIVFSRPKKFKSTASTSKRINFRSNILGNKTEYLDELQKNEIMKLRNTGVAAIKFFILNSNPENIYLFGFNFYSSSYHDKTLEEFFKDRSKLENHKIARARIEKSFISVVMEHPRINFNFFGDYKFTNPPNNLKIFSRN